MKDHTHYLVTSSVTIWIILSFTKDRILHRTSQIFLISALHKLAHQPNKVQYFVKYWEWLKLMRKDIKISPILVTVLDTNPEFCHAFSVTRFYHFGKFFKFFKVYLLFDKFYMAIRVYWLDPCDTISVNISWTLINHNLAILIWILFRLKIYKKQCKRYFTVDFSFFWSLTWSFWPSDVVYRYDTVVTTFPLFGRLDHLGPFWDRSSIVWTVWVPFKNIFWKYEAVYLKF